MQTNNMTLLRKNKDVCFAMVAEEKRGYFLLSFGLNKLLPAETSEALQFFSSGKLIC